MDLKKANEQAINNWKSRQGPALITQKKKKNKLGSRSGPPLKIKQVRGTALGTRELKERKGKLTEVYHEGASPAWGCADGFTEIQSVDSSINDHYNRLLAVVHPEVQGELCLCGLKHEGE